MNKPPLRERARHHWRSILPQLGVSAEYLTGKHGPCPVCCDGVDRFRFDNKDGVGRWICSHCGSGDGVGLIMKTRGIDFIAAKELIDPLLGDAVPEAPPKSSDPEKERLSRERLWNRSRAIRTGDPAGRYLRSRLGVEGPWPASLRYCSSAHYQDGQHGEPSYHPAMVAMVRDGAGKPIALHRTYLTMDGTQADVERVKKLSRGAGALVGHSGAIRLGEPLHGVLGVAEGLETALAASVLFGIPVWSLISAPNMQSWEPPEGVTDVVIFADHDVNAIGVVAASVLMMTLLKRRVRAEIHMPDAVGGDYASELVRLRPGLGLCEGKASPDRCLQPVVGSSGAPVEVATMTAA